VEGPWLGLQKKFARRIVFTRASRTEWRSGGNSVHRLDKGSNEKGKKKKGANIGIFWSWQKVLNVAASRNPPSVRPERNGPNR